MVFYYTSLNLSELQNWYSKNLNMTVTSGVDQIDWVITLTAANGTVEFRPFHPRNMTYNPASFIPHLLEEFDGHGLSYTFNFNTSTEVDRWDIYSIIRFALQRCKKEKNPEFWSVNWALVAGLHISRIDFRRFHESDLRSSHEGTAVISGIERRLVSRTAAGNRA